MKKKIRNRLLWLHDDQELDALRVAASRSAVFDRAFGFSLSLDKCSLTARFPDPALQALARELGFQEAEALLRFHSRKSILRARLLGWVANNRNIKRQLLISVVVPSMAWAASFARPSHEDLQAVQQEIEHTFSSSFVRGFATVRLYEALGWQMNPHFACDLGALCVLRKACIQPPSWLDHVPLRDAHFQWEAMICQALLLFLAVRCY